MLRRWFPRVRAASRDALRYISSEPLLLGFYVTLLLWSALGLLTVFVGLFGLAVQALVLIVLAAGASVIVFWASHEPIPYARVHGVAALGLSLAVVASCPNRAGPYVFFAVHGARLDALARDVVGARCDLWLGVSSPPYGYPPVNVAARDVDHLRARLRSTGAMSMRATHGWVVFQVDEVDSDDALGFVYVRPGAAPPTLEDHLVGRQPLVPMSRPGWSFYSHAVPTRGGLDIDAANCR